MSIAQNIFVPEDEKRPPQNGVEFPFYVTALFSL